MGAVRLFADALRRLNNVISAVAIAIGMAVIAFAAIALFAQAVERYVSGQGYAWMNDFPPFLVPWCVFPVMGVLLRGDRHINVEVAPHLLKGVWRGRALILLRLVIGLICLVSGVYFCNAGWAAVEFFQMLGELTETEIRIPFWWLYAAFPAGFAVMALFALERVLDESLALLGMPPTQANT